MELSGMKPVQLANAAGVTPQAVGRWLRGEVEDLYSVHLFHVADATQVDARWLATGQGEPRPPAGALSFTGKLLAEKIGSKSDATQRVLNDLIDQLD
jgi:transcriptional regulator with XRE-family HTH domain